MQTTADLVGCPECGAVARAKDRRPTWVRDLPIGGRPVVLCWWKRVWCCPHPLCEQRTWTERHPAIAPRAGLTERARAWAFEQVGAADAAVSRTATVLGVAWWTVMRQVIDRGTPLVDDPARLAGRGRGRGRRDRLPARHRHPVHDVRHRDRRPDPGPAGAAAGRGRRPLGHRAGRLAGRAGPGVAGRDRHRLAGPVPRLRHRPDQPAARRGAGARPVPRRPPRPGRASTTSAAASSRPRPGTAAAPATRSTASAGSCAAAPTTSRPRRGPGWRPG